MAPFLETTLLDWLMLILNRQLAATGDHIQHLKLEPELYWPLHQDFCVYYGFESFDEGGLPVDGPRHIVLVEEDWNDEGRK